MGARRMDRVWIGSGVAAAVVIAAAGWLFFVSPQLDAKANSEQQLADTQTQNIVLQQKINKLKDQNDHAGELQDQLDAARAGVPTQHDMDAFTRQLNAQADAAKITIQSISPSQPTPILQPSQPAAAPSSDSTDTSSDTTTDSSAPETSDAAAAPAAPASSAQIYSIAVTVITAGPINGQRDFLSLLEKQGPRRALVVSTAFSPDSTAAAAPTTGPLAGADRPDAEAEQWTMTTQLQIFVAPQAPTSDSAAPTTPEPASNG